MQIINCTVPDCFVGHGATYRGQVSITDDGLVCQRWEDQTPHEHRFLDLSVYGLSENYCRNPDGEKRPWCYTRDPSVRWQYCNVKPCGCGYSRSTGSVKSYQWDIALPESSPLVFKVKTSAGAHIALSSQGAGLNYMYEIVIGGWENTKSVIRREPLGEKKVTASTPGILSPDEFRIFWVSWTQNGAIAVGRVGESSPFMQWQDPNPLGIGYFGYSTGWGYTGEFEFLCARDKNIMEYQKLGNTEYKVFPLKKTYSRAQQTCASDGGRLAVIKTEAVFSFLVDLIQRVDGFKDYWFGLNDMAVENRWTWSDGTPLRGCGFTKWFPGEPNSFGGDQDCGSLWAARAFLWDDNDCDFETYFICQIGPGEECTKEKRGEV
ncbi:uncharacterized protein LOC144912807 [Branchiostoma floridae x Branchiostoma belcheri]